MMTLSKLSKEQNKTIVMVTHTTQNLHLCDKIIFMEWEEGSVFVGMLKKQRNFIRQMILSISII